jgi:hypothetical protein
LNSCRPKINPITLFFKNLHIHVFWQIIGVGVECITTMKKKNYRNMKDNVINAKTSKAIKAAA